MQVHHHAAKKLASRSLVILACALFLGLAAAAGNLRIALATEAPSLDVHVTSSAVVYHSLIYASLISRDPYTGDFVPYLATDWEVLDDGLRIRFWLREDVTFTDGTPLTAEAVKVSFERLMDPAMAAPAASNAGALDHVEIVDDYTVDVVYSEPFAAALLNMTNAYFGIISPTALATQGSAFSQNPVSAGPFKIREVVSGDRIVLERNPDYAWAPPYFVNQGAAYLDTVTILFIPDDATQLLLLQTNGLDIASAPERDVLRLLQSGNLGEGADLQNYSYTIAGVTYLGLTTCCGRAAENVEIRKAIAYAINRDEIVATVLEGMGTPVAGLYSPSTWGYDPDMTGYPFDLEASAATLEALGYSLGASGFYESGGQPLTIEVWTYNTPTWVRLAQVVQAQLADAGIDMQIQQMESATLLGSTNRGEHDGLLISYGWSDAGILSYFFHSRALATTNRIHFNNAEADRLLDLGNATVDTDTRFGIYQDLQRLILDEAPWVPLYAAQANNLVRSEVEGLIINPFSAGLLYHDVYIGTKD